ncbi:MAG TPA: hypothetical protein VFT19_07615 [Solirubrobacterales bacterium]|nr:hypothetical protein [Solirubrobacterales bacterium]
MEALWYIDEPLSAVSLVNVFDGKDISMWDAAHDLRVLEELGVVEAYPAGHDPLARRDAFDLPYRLKAGGLGNAG